jgi:ABC-type arginine transport system permease subunit
MELGHFPALIPIALPGLSSVALILQTMAQIMGVWMLKDLGLRSSVHASASHTILFFSRSENVLPGKNEIPHL